MSDAGNRDPDFYRQLRSELSDGWRWLDRAIVLAYGAAAGALVVVFTFLSNLAHAAFVGVNANLPLLMLVWTPLLTAGIVWTVRRWWPTTAGSGIPQTIAALDPALDAQGRSRFVSLRLSLVKVLAGAVGLLGGLSIGREGPSVQVAAGVMQHCQRWIRQRQSVVSPHALVVAGGAAGIAAAFNAPLAGVVFAFEELSRQLEARYSGVLIAVIVLAGLMGVSVFGNHAYFGQVKVPPLDWDLLLPGMAVALLCGLAGGLMAKLLIVSLTGQSQDWLSRWRRREPVRFAAAIGLAVAIIGLATDGQTYGSGTDAVHEMLHAEQLPASIEVFALLKAVATWLTAWSGVPGGLFAPSLSVGAGIGYNVSALASPEMQVALIAMGMAGFLAAVTQAPITSFIIVMEMIDGRPMVLSLMAVAMVSAGVSRMISRPLYATLAANMLAPIHAAQAERQRQQQTTASDGAPGADRSGAAPLSRAVDAAPASAAPSPAAATAPPASTWPSAPPSPHPP